MSNEYIEHMDVDKLYELKNAVQWYDSKPVTLCVGDDRFHENMNDFFIECSKPIIDRFILKYAAENNLEADCVDYGTTFLIINDILCIYIETWDNDVGDTTTHRIVVTAK